MKRTPLHRTIITAFLLATLAFPATAWAAGPPLPPPGPFTAPLTPTPAPLPTSTPLPEPEPEPERVIPGPEESAPVLFLPWISVPQPRLTAAAETPAFSQAPAVSTPLPAAAPEPMRWAQLAVNPLAASFTYRVQPGDTLADLAIEFGRDLNTMSCAWQEDGSRVQGLQAGEEIVVPAPGDLCHRARAGETLDSIAAWYGISAESLLAAPGNTASLRTGQFLLVPGAASRYRDPVELNLPRPRVSGWHYGDGEFIWPVDRDKVWISQRFRHGPHMAIDLAARIGTPVRAADTGVVIKAGWSEIGYGYRIVIDHGIDYITLYAHLSEYYVQEGDIVQKGDLIGAVGSTGNSTGPHLHFEMRDHGYLIDPLLVLPGQSAGDSKQ